MKIETRRELRDVPIHWTYDTQLVGRFHVVRISKQAANFPDSAFEEHREWQNLRVSVSFSTFKNKSSHERHTTERDQVTQFCPKKSTCSLFSLALHSTLAPFLQQRG